MVKSQMQLRLNSLCRLTGGLGVVPQSFKTNEKYPTLIHRKNNHTVSVNKLSHPNKLI